MEAVGKGTDGPDSRLGASGLHLDDQWKSLLLYTAVESVLRTVLYFDPCLFRLLLLHRPAPPEADGPATSSKSSKGCE